MLTPLTATQAAHQIKKLMPSEPHERRLSHYYQAGRLAARVDSAYGAKAIDQLYRELGALDVPGLKYSMLVKCRRFAKHATPTQVQGLQKLNVPWREASNMLSNNNISDAQRHQLLDRLTKGTLPPDELGRAIRKMVGSKVYTNPKAIVAAQNESERVLRRLHGMLSNAPNEHVYDATLRIALDLKRNLTDLLRGVASGRAR